MSRSSVWFSGPLVGLFVLASCGGGAPSASAPAASKPAASAPASPAAPATASASGEPAAASQAAASGRGPIKVGVVLPFTGPLANSAKDNQDGFNLALAAVNNTVAGRPLQPVFADDQNQADVGLTKAKQLVENEKVQMLAGLSSTAVCYAIAPYAKQTGIPTIVTANCGGQALTIDPKMSSPNIVRLTQNVPVVLDPPADWAYKQGYRKAIVVASDYGGGLETVDAFASAFIKRGGSIVQEIYPPLGTSDYGTYLAQLNQGADLLFTFLPGVDGLHFLDQLGNYVGQKKLPIIDAFGTATNGPNLAQLKDKAVGVIGEGVYSTAIDSPENKAFLKAVADKYPGRLLSSDLVQGYMGAQIIAETIKAVGGNVEDSPRFLEALYRVDVKTAKGPVKLDADHDVIEDIYVFEIVKTGDSYTQKLLQTYPGVSKTWARGADEVTRFPWGKNKGKWVGMTGDKLAELTK